MRLATPVIWLCSLFFAPDLGDPILSSLSSLRSLTFDLATLYGTLYGPPSIPILLNELSAATRISTIGFIFTLDTYAAPLDSAVEKLERIRLAQTEALLREFLPFSELQDLSIQVRSDEWARLKKHRSVDAWVASVEDRRIDVEPETPPEPVDAWGDQALEEILHPTPLQSKLHRLHAEYDTANSTWRRVTGVFQKAFPTMAARNILRVEPLADGLSERARAKQQYRNTHHRERLDTFPYYTLFL